jgi:hypothetical protein
MSCKWKEICKKRPRCVNGRKYVKRGLKFDSHPDLSEGVLAGDAILPRDYKETCRIRPHVMRV